MASYGRCLREAFKRGWSLRKLAYASVQHPVGTGCYGDVHELVHAGRKIVIPRPKWEWAEADGQRRVWAEDGALHSGSVNTSDLYKTELLADFKCYELRGDRRALLMSITPVKAP